MPFKAPAITRGHRCVTLFVAMHSSCFKRACLLPHFALEEDLSLRDLVEGVARPHLGSMDLAQDPGGRSLDVPQSHAHVTQSLSLLTIIMSRNIF